MPPLAATSMLHAGVLAKPAFLDYPRPSRFSRNDAGTHADGGVLCMFSIVYGGFVAYYAKDTKYVIRYSVRVTWLWFLA